MTLGMRVALVVTSLLAGSLLLGGAAAVGCSSSSDKGTGTTPTKDAGSGDECEAIDSACGQPCQAGNNLGIGRFCNTLHDCDGTQIPTLCATLGEPNEHFCTASCEPPDSGDEAGLTTTCGENATCQCQGGQCGCFPNSCM
jgi:hypothetical protein